MRHRIGRAFALALSLVLIASVVQAQGTITTPKAFFGHNIGDDYFLANYDQFMAYWRKIDAESDRMRVIEIGKTAEGRPQLAAIVTAPQNFARLDRYKEIARRLAHAEGIDSAQARALAKEGKAVVWIDGGLHATEVLGAHQLMETSYQFVSRSDDETMRILNDVIIVFVHANPDGMQLVSNWYMSEKDTLRRNTQIPRLYQKYIGHDNNRDFYMSAQPETQNLNHQLYWEWFPQIMYNHHQTGPAGSVMFAPPFRDPHNPHFDRLIVSSLDLVGAAMHNRFIAENKPGVVMRRGANYSTWWNGGLRTTVYFHNMIGLLTETIGNPTPIRIPLIPGRQEPTADVPFPIEPQEWHFRRSIDYSVTANYAVLDIAQRYRETFLYNIWRMGMNSIERGRKDTWTVTGPEVDKLRAAADSARRVAQAGGQAGQGGGGGGGGFGQAAPVVLYDRILRDPADRDPRAYVLSAAQTDFPTATKFVNTLRHVGVTVERATRDFTIGGKTYPAGSYVVPMAQAFRPHALDMFEPQEHPNDFAYPGAPPTRPYDNAGYTLAYQMGVQFDRILDAYTCPCERITGLATPPPATVASASGATGFILTPKQNDAFIAVSRLLKGRAAVSRLTAPFTSGGRTYPVGSFYVPASGNVTQIVQTAASQLGIAVAGVTSRPGSMAAIRTPRIALWDNYGGSMPSGWTRWIMEQYELPFTVVYPAEINAGNLRAKYDVLVLPDGAIPNPGGGFGGGGGGGQQRQPPDSLRHMVGRLGDQTVPHIRAFLEAGGEVLAIGSSTRLGYMLNLPVKNALVERTASGEEKELPGEKFYIPGSLLEVAVDTTASIAWGSPRNVDVMFDDSPAFRLDADAASKGLRTIAWYDSATPLRSGWAWGQNHLNGTAAIVEARIGQGSLYLYGPEILFRSQPHGTFRFFFNALLDPSRSPSPPTP